LIIEQLQGKLLQYKKRDKLLREEMAKEQMRRREAELQCAVVLKKAQELNAYQNTIQSYYIGCNSNTKGTNTTATRNGNTVILE
jgi:hypothetical protein